MATDIGSGAKEKELKPVSPRGTLAKMSPSRLEYLLDRAAAVFGTGGTITEFQKQTGVSYDTAKGVETLYLQKKREADASVAQRLKAEMEREAIRSRKASLGYGRELEGLLGEEIAYQKSLPVSERDVGAMMKAANLLWKLRRSTTGIELDEDQQKAQAGRTLIAANTLNVMDLGALPVPAADSESADEETEVIDVEEVDEW